MSILKFCLQLLIFSYMLSSSIKGQYTSNTILLSGNIIDAESERLIPYASITLPTLLKGTTADENGYFQLRLPVNILENEDSIIVSHLGYENTVHKLHISEVGKSLDIHMYPQSVILEDYHSTPLTALQHLKIALQSIKNNYDTNPYYVISYMDNNIYENSNLLLGSESVFKSYLVEQANVKDKNETNKHQLLLYRTKPNVTPLNFMKKEWGKIQAREIQDWKENTTKDSSFILRFTPLFLMIYSPMINFLDSNQFNKFQYDVSQRCNTHNIMSITVSTKKAIKNKYIKFTGKSKIYINCDDYAIVKLDLDIIGKIPFWARTFIWLTMKKVNLKTIHVKGKIEFSKQEKFWYPHKTVLWGDCNLTKTRWFKKNDRSNFEIFSSNIVNDIIFKNISPITPQKEFSFSKLVIDNDMNLEWDKLIKLNKQKYE